MEDLTVFQMPGSRARLVCLGPYRKTRQILPPQRAACLHRLEQVPPFVPGLELAASFYSEVIEPRLAGLAHSAALIGTGSDVLGYDDLRSTDHGWGPRLQLFAAEHEVEAVRRALEGLPEEYRGWPTVIGSDRVPLRKQVDVWTISGWVMSRLGVDPRPGLSSLDWLALPQQLLLEVTAGRVFHDGLGELQPLRVSLAWYPHDVWLWLLTAQWHRIAHEEAFVGRAVEVGDDLGSRIVASRVVRDLIRLCFLQEKVYAPYSKWLGTAFAGLASAATIGPALAAALAATTYPERESALVEAYQAVADRHNGLGITRVEEPRARLFHERPFRILGADRFADACLGAIATSPYGRSRSSEPWISGSTRRMSSAIPGGSVC